MPLYTHKQLSEKVARIDAQIERLKQLIKTIKVVGKEVNDYLAYIDQCTEELNHLVDEIRAEEGKSNGLHT